MAHRNIVEFTEKGARNIDTISSPHTFPHPSHTQPVQTTQRHIAPIVTNIKKRHVLPHAVCNMAPVDAERLATLTFEMEDISAPFVNMLRRVILTEVPTMAIDRALVHENDGVVLDELLSHRLGIRSPPP